MTTSEDHHQQQDPPVLHVLVIGFHHKKGCQVDYSYPPLMPGEGGEGEGSPGTLGPNSLPSQWKQLPSLAMPDGSHNFQSDTAFFHLPALDNPRKTVFGISCYRQIDSEKVVNRTADMTRGSVQKCVCVLSRLPLYGQIQVKMSLITEAYFREGDFSRVDLIHQTYDNLNSCLTDDMLHSQQLYVGLSARAFVQRFRQKALVLFKLMLLERKVLFMQSPVNELCSFFLTLLSLHPGMLEAGLDEAARMVPVETPPSVSPCQEEPPVLAEEANEEEPDQGDDDNDEAKSTNSDRDRKSPSPPASGIKNRLTGAFGYIAGIKPNSSDSLGREDQRSVSSLEDGVGDKAEEAIPAPSFQTINSMKTEAFGLPLNIFTGGNLCHPYLSISYLDILCQPSIHGYLIGATNILFKQKRGIAEVVVDIEQDRQIIHDPDLKRALQLTTEDLRFIDNVIKHVSEESSDVFLDGVGWEGGDEWVRAQFRFYLVCLLRTSLLEEVDSGEAQYFNPSFMQQWKQTKNWKCWRGSDQAASIKDDIPPGHPFSGHLSVTDMKLHFSNTISNTEGGKKVSQVVSNTSRAVAGGISTAKGAFSSMFSFGKKVDGGPSPEPERREVAPVHTQEK